MIEHLMGLGLTEIESRCYIALYEKPRQSGYEVAKTIGVSRSNVYASLASLVKKGACTASEDKTTYYSAVPIKDVLAKVRLEFKQSARFLRQELGKTPQAPFELSSAYGDEAVEQVLMRTLGGGESEIYAEIDRRDQSYFETIFRDLDLQPEIHWIETNPSNFMFVIDQERVVTGSLDASLVASVMTTVHPVLVARFMKSIKQ